MAFIPTYTYMEQGQRYHSVGTQTSYYSYVGSDITDRMLIDASTLSRGVSVFFDGAGGKDILHMQQNTQQIIGFQQSDEYGSTTSFFPTLQASPPRVLIGS